MAKKRKSHRKRSYVRALGALGTAKTASQYMRGLYSVHKAGRNPYAVYRKGKGKWSKMYMLPTKRLAKFQEKRLKNLLDYAWDTDAGYVVRKVKGKRRAHRNPSLPKHMRRAKIGFDAKGMWIDVGMHRDYPMQHMDGHIVYDRPELIPMYAKEMVRRAFKSKKLDTKLMKAFRVGKNPLKAPMGQFIFGGRLTFKGRKIDPGDRVTIRNRTGGESSGRVVMSSPDHVVLNMGGRYGTPQVADLNNIVRVTKGR